MWASFTDSKLDTKGKSLGKKDVTHKKNDIGLVSPASHFAMVPQKQTPWAKTRYAVMYQTANFYISWSTSQVAWYTSAL